MERRSTTPMELRSTTAASEVVRLCGRLSSNAWAVHWDKKNGRLRATKWRPRPPGRLADQKVKRATSCPFLGCTAKLVKLMEPNPELEVVTPPALQLVLPAAIAPLVQVRDPCGPLDVGLLSSR